MFVCSTNKKYLVTGASSGIGKDICKLLLQQNADVIMVSRSKENLSNAVEDIGKELDRKDFKNKIRMEVLDLSDIESVRKFT